MHVYMGGETEYGITLRMPKSHPYWHMRYFSSQLSRHVVRGVLRSLNLACVGPGTGAYLYAEQESLRELVEKWYLQDSNSNSESAAIIDIEQKDIVGDQDQNGHIDVWLGNGGRFYIDCGHPEYSTPVVSNPRDALIAQRTGDLIVEQGRKAAQACLRKEFGESIDLLIYKNNSDGQGATAQSYAHHENYSLEHSTLSRIFTVENYSGRKVIIPRDLAPPVMNFLISRILISGAGKVGRDVLRRPCPYQISQRADFFGEQFGEHTTGNRRPIINTRQEPYATTCGRLHVIPGDTNVSDLAIYLTWGTGQLFFMMLQDGYIERYGRTILKQLHRPVCAFWAVSGDLTLRKKLRCKDGSRATALLMQQEFCEIAGKFVAEKNLGDPWSDVVKKWNDGLVGLDGDRTRRTNHAVSNNFDWVMKEDVLLRYQRNRGTDWNDPKCKNLDLAYHDINPERSIAEILRRRGDLVSLVSEDEVRHWVHAPPTDTRSFLLGAIIGRHDLHLYGADWSSIIFPHPIGTLSIEDPGVGTAAETGHLLKDDPSCIELGLRLEQWIRHAKPSGYRWRLPYSRLSSPRD